MSIHRLTPRGQVPSAKIDVLLAQYEPDEWLPAALAVPFGIGLFACVLMAIGLTLVVFLPKYMQVGLTLAALWCVAVFYSCVSMEYLSRCRRTEYRRRQLKKDPA